MTQLRDWQRRLLISAIALAILIFIIIPYAYRAAMRSGTQECSRETHDSYIGELCYTPREWGMVFRLYDTHSGELLAERDFLDPDVKGLLWIDNQVQYDFSPVDGKGFVALPPTWLDRLRAKLP